MIHLRPDQRPLLVRALNEAWLGDELHRPASAILHNEWPAKAEDLAQDAPLAADLAVGPLKDSVLEVRLTAVRRELLLRPLTNALAPLLLRIASQCFINEYAWGVSAEEAAEVQRLRDAPITGESLAKLAAYLPLYSLDGAEQLLDREWPAPLQALLRQQVAEPFKERQIATAIPALTAITAGVSEVVREMYEENPYPRWSRATPPRPPSACAGDPVRSSPGCRLTPFPMPEAPHILIAGCGTGGHALHVAGRYAGAKVLAVDLSLSSLAYAKRKTEELRAANITYGQADLLELQGEFDVIDAAGSLQCMADPDEGARKLVSRLRPGGLMRFGLYSNIARAYRSRPANWERVFPTIPTASGRSDRRS